MSLLRRLAVRISATVARYASPGCKEWAEGLAREVAFIPGDWAALRWAIGSVRVLFTYREAPISSFADLSAVAAKDADSKRKGKFGSILFLLFICLYGNQFLHSTNGLDRIGCGLIVLGYTSIEIFLLIQWRRRLKVPPEDDVLAVVQFYKTELERMCKWPMELWLSGPSLGFIFVGLMLLELRDRADWRLDAFLVLVWVGWLLPHSHKLRINRRRRLEQVKALLAERP